MTHMRQCFVFLMLVSAAKCWGADQDLYRAYLGMVGTNAPMNVATPSPLLIDTNNLTPKLTNSVLDLADTKAKGQMAEIRFGMTMEQVAACWGKPSWFWSRCYGGPRFCYAGGVSVIFDPNSNSVSRVLWIRHEPPDFPRFAAGLAAASSSVEEYVRVLGNPSSRKAAASSSVEEYVRFPGNPSSRKDDKDTAWCELVYTTPAATLRLEFEGGTLHCLSLDRPSYQSQPRK